MAREQPPSRLGFILDSALLAGLTALLIGPLFSLVYLANWGAIESIFIAHVRFLIENWPHPAWQPLWYGGTRFDYIYPPALPYGTAFGSMLLGVPIAQAYHIYVGAMYSLGVAGVYAMARTMSGSRASGWLAAAATALVSPCALLVQELYNDAAARSFAPQRLNVLVGWGEGPHVCALALIPFALAASYQALRTKSKRWTAAAALLCALVVWNNFYGGVTLVIGFGFLVWGLWVCGRDKLVWIRALAIGLPAYGLSAFWLTPSYLRVTMANLKLVQVESDSSDLGLALLIVALYLTLSYWWGRARPERFYAIFSGGLALTFAVILLSRYWLDLKVLESAARFSPEFDMALILAAVEIQRRLAIVLLPKFAKTSRGAVTGVAVGVAGTAILAAPYLRNAWEIYPEDPDHKQRIEYRLAEWAANNLGGTRAFVDGSTRLWWDSWFDLPQYWGGSEQGILNQTLFFGMWEMRLGTEPAHSVLWMQSFGVDAIVVHETRSQEIYDNFEHPKKFAGMLPVLYDSGEGDTIYRVPRRFPSRARVVEHSALEHLQAPSWGGDVAQLSPYVEAVENGPDREATLEWHGPEEMRVTAETAVGQWLLLQVSYDGAWRAYEGDRLLAMRRGPFGQMLIETAPGRHAIRLVFETPGEVVFGRILAFLSLCFIAFLLWAGDGPASSKAETC